MCIRIQITLIIVAGANINKKAINELLTVIATTVTKVSNNKVNRVLFRKFCFFKWFEIIACSITFPSPYTILTSVFAQKREVSNTPLYMICKSSSLMNMIKNGNIRMKILTMASLLYLVTLSVVSAEGSTLDTSDNVAMTFWIATALMLASTVFFVLERQNVSDKWKTSMTVAALVTGVAWYHYTYMRDHWVMTGDSPLVLRYVDWLITVPVSYTHLTLPTKA